MLFISKLSPEQWAEARQLRAEGATFQALAVRFGLTPSTIAARARRDSWASLKEPTPRGPRSQRRRTKPRARRPRARQVSLAPPAAPRDASNPAAPTLPLVPTSAAEPGTPPQRPRRKRGLRAIQRSFKPRLYRLIDIQLRLQEIRMDHQLTAVEANAAAGNEPPSADLIEKDTRHAGALIKSISQIAELNPDLASTTIGGRVFSGAATADAAQRASEADAFRREIAERLAKLIPPA